MLTITVEFLAGTYRADPDGTAITGRQDRGEWPPSPLRLLAALVAADGTGARCRYTDGSELAVLEGAPPPRISAAAPSRVHHQPLLSRFVVKHTGGGEKGSQHQEYPARTGTEVRPGVRVSPADSLVRYVWDIDVDERTIDALDTRAARVGYLGCADSPVRVSAFRELGGGHDGEWYEPDPDGAVTLGVPRPGVLAAMDAHHEAWERDGADVARSQFPGLRRLARYRPPGAETLTDEPGEPVVLWFLFDEAVPGRRVLAVAEALRGAVLERYQRAAGEPPSVLTGHGFSTRGFEQARYLALPDVGHPRSRGRLHGAALWLPPDTPPEVVGVSRGVLGTASVLAGRGFRTGMSPYDGRSRPWAAQPSRWAGPSERWVTAVPAVYERRVRELTLPDIVRWCAHAGLPEPVAARSSRGRLLPGAVQLAPPEARREGKEAKPYAHVEVVFAEPVRGPVVIGGARQWGLGLCAPVRVDGG